MFKLKILSSAVTVFYKIMMSTSKQEFDAAIQFLQEILESKSN